MTGRLTAIFLACLALWFLTHAVVLLIAMLVAAVLLLVL